MINIFSKRADFTDTVQTGGELYGRYGTNDRENTETFDFHVTGPTMAFSAGLTHQDVDDYRGPGEGRLSPPGLKLWVAMPILPSGRPRGTLSASPGFTTNGKMWTATYSPS
ncbi:hypothetical protein [Verrucomicrobium spinosum]|uniref:hypothetical protein n=1 Tax=Verrucomicrobium spinosum TaxID=2736 RepID=UPI0009467E07|nr:hypothetical protein [Verrucomicrobium spinosum]